MPRLITSTPAARLSAILRSSWANAYGGIFSRRLLGFMQLLFELVADRAGEDRPRPACQVHAQVCCDLDLQLAPVEHDRHRPGTVSCRALVGVRHGRAGRAGPRGERLPHPALENPGADLRRLDLRV